MANSDLVIASNIDADLGLSDPAEYENHAVRSLPSLS